MKKVIYTGVVLMFGTLAILANPISNFKPYEKEAGTDQPNPETSQENQDEHNETPQVRHHGQSHGDHE